VLGGADLQNYAMLVQTIKRQASVMAYNEAFLLVGLMLFLASLASLMIRPPAANATASMAGH
jgi:DHA2 family multidrug resistance protein